MANLHFKYGYSTILTPFPKFCQDNGTVKSNVCSKTSAMSTHQSHRYILRVRNNVLKDFRFIDQKVHYYLFIMEWLLALFCPKVAFLWQILENDGQNYRGI